MLFIFFNVCFLTAREVLIWSQSNIQPVLCQAGSSPQMDGLIHVRTSLKLEIRKGKFFALHGYHHFSANPFWYVYYTTATSFHMLYQNSSWHTPRFKRRQAVVPEYSPEKWFLTSSAISVTYTSTAMLGTYKSKREKYWNTFEMLLAQCKGLLLQIKYCFFQHISSDLITCPFLLA